MSKYLAFFLLSFLVGCAPGASALSVGAVDMQPLYGPILQLLLAVASTVFKWLWDKYGPGNSPPAAPLAEASTLSLSPAPCGL